MKSFDQLDTRPKVGDSVWVTDAQGREAEGRVRGLHDASVTLDGNGQTTLQADNVRLVQRASKSIGKAALWGLGIGGIAGGATEESCETMCGAGPGAVLGAASGAGIGGLVRALLPPGRRGVYRAGGASASAQLTLAPMITPRMKGVAVAFSF